jgi:hypothetical protein
VSYRDVDAQGSYPLLQDLAQTGGGVLWAATHAVTGPFLWIEDPPSRTALSTFALSGGQIVIVERAGRDERSRLRPARGWRRVAPRFCRRNYGGCGDVARARVDDEGQPETTERTETVTDTAALATYGTRRLSVSTELISQADAAAMANRLARASSGREMAPRRDHAGHRDRSRDQRQHLGQSGKSGLLNMLDGTIRMGLALLLVDMPAYAPLGAVSAYYVEGGTYEFTDGFWSLALTATPSGSQGKSATWADIKTEQPTWRWDQWAPTIEWQDAFGVVVA